MKRARSRLGLLFALGMLTAGLPLGPVAPALAVTTHISEFHYDNVGTDEGEFIEVTADAGTDLTDWTIALYNGSNGQVYGTIALDVVVDDEGSGVGAVDFQLPANGLQNGAPDGFALVDPTNVAIEFLSYEGSLTATNGPANGMTSTDVGVAESSSTPVGDSLQLVAGTWIAGSSSPGLINPVPSTPPSGTGTATPDAADPGATTNLVVVVVPGTNPDSTGIAVTADLTAIGGTAGQAFTDDGGNSFSYVATIDPGTTPGPVTLPVTISDAEGREGTTSIALTVSGSAPPPGELLFTQYLEGSSFNKAIEITNIGTDPVDLSTFSLELYSNGASSPSQSTALSGSLAAGGAYVMANPSAAAEILAVADSTSGSVINWNGDDAIVLRSGGAVVDSIGQVGFDPGSEWGDATVGTQNDSLCRLESVTSGDSDPTDVFDPALEWTGNGIDVFDGLGLPGCEPLPLITQYVEGSSNNKAIEIANLGSLDIDLSTYRVEVYFNGSMSVGTTVSLTGSLAGGTTLVLADDGASAEILAVADLTTTSSLWNGDDAIALVGPTGVVDVIGQIGFDPGSEWGDATTGTQNETLCRLDTITIGDSDPSDAFDPALEWTAIGNDVIYGLGEVGCEPPAPQVKIHEIQGDGAVSPLKGTAVAIEGIVVGDFQDGSAGTSGDLNGYFVQEEPGDYDADPDTSEGIFVYDPATAVDVAVGDLVRVTGTVSEYETSGGASSETQLGFIGNVEIISSGNDLPAATEVILPYTDVTDLEAFEGMYVVFGSSQDLFIAEYFNYDRFNEMVLATDPRPAQPTAVFEPGSAEAANLADLNSRSRITLDDGRTIQNPFPSRHPDGSDFSTANIFRGGDQLNDVYGGLGESFGLYRIQPTTGAAYTSLNPRSAAPDDVSGTVKVASFNVLNYFTTVDAGSPICGPDQNQGCRGADTADELSRQRAKIIAALAAIDADIVGLIEIENNPATTIDEPLADLVQGLNDAVGDGTYAYVDTGPIGTDAIKVALIYKPASVSLDGGFSILDSSVDPLFDDDRNRPALAQTFVENGNGEAFTVVVNHLKSKGSACGAGDDDPEQGNCNGTRTDAATALANWRGDSINPFDEDVLIIGDLNSYDKEDPIDALTGGGYVDLALNLIGEDAYSYVFSGQWGYLDYAMANASLRPAVTGTTIWHINSDEADLLDYDTSFNDPRFYVGDAYRSSDHDPVIVGLDLTPPEVSAEFDKIGVGHMTGLFEVDFECVDEVDPDPTCVGDINGIAVEDDQRVFLIKAPRGRGWHRMIGSILFIKDSSFVLTVTGTDAAGNAATATAEPEFRERHHRHRAL